MHLTCLQNMGSRLEKDAMKSNTIYVGGKPKSISFSGCGFLGVFHIGVASCLKQHAPGLIESLDRIYGCSAGSIMGAMLLTDVCFGEVCQRTMNIVMDARSRYFGPLSPGFRLNEILLRDIRSGLPQDAHIRATGKLFISLTRLHDRKNVIVSEYRTREELIQVLICSCFVPFYSGLIPPKYRGVYHVDGGLSNNLPADHDTITVSPWSGNSDICPSNDGVSLVDLNFVNTSIQMTASNMYRVSAMLFPPKPEVLKEFCSQGFRETIQYLRDNGLFETIEPMKKNISFSSQLHKVEERRRKTRRMSQSVGSMTDSQDDNEAIFDVVYDSDNISTKSEESDSAAEEKPVEMLDENENRASLVALADDDQTCMKPRNVFTVIHAYPTHHDHVIRVQFQLPSVVLEALEFSFEDSKSTWKKPLYNLLSSFGQSLVVRMPLEKTYSTACFLLRHAKSIPDDVRWLADHIRHLVERLHSHFKCSGKYLLEKLKHIDLKTEKEVAMLSHHLMVGVQLLTRALLAPSIPYYPSWLTSVINKQSSSSYSSLPITSSKDTSVQ